MKIVREEIDYKKQMENNNKNMKKSEETDTVIAVDPTYANAMEQDKKAEEKVGEIMKKKKEEQKSIEIPDPSTGKPLKKNMYTKQEELDESLFDDGDGEEVKEEKNTTKLPGDVFTMVYDFIFDGLHKSPAEIKGLEDVEDVVVGAEKYFQDVQNFTNIGVQIKDDEKNIAEYVKKIADALGFSTSEKRYERGVKNGDYVLFVEIPKDVAVMKASKFLGKDESLKEENKINEKGLTSSERHNRMMNKIFAGHDKYVDKMANFLSERGVSDEEIAELKKGVGLGKDAMRDKIVELGLEDEFKKTSESLKEARSPRFELEIWVPGSGGDDDRERSLIETDDIGDILETIYKTKLDSGEAFLFSDLRRNFELDQEYSQEDMYNDLKDRLGDEFDFSDWDEYFEDDSVIVSTDWKRESIGEGKKPVVKPKKLTESWEGEDIIDDLADSAKAFISDGNSKEKAIEKAIDGGLIANWDRVILGWHYDVIDTGKIIEDIYPMLVRDIEERLDKEEDKDESLKEGKKPVIEKSETKVEKYRGMTIEEIFWDVVGDKFKVFDNDGHFTPKAEKNYNKVAKAYGEDAFDELCNSEKCFKEGKSLKEAKNKLTEDAKIYISLSDYKPWSGAVDTFEKIRREDKMDELDAFIEEVYPDGLTDTELNDLLWFEPEYVFDSLGIDYEDEDEEDEDEDDEIELDFEEEDEEETDEE